MPCSLDCVGAFLPRTLSRPAAMDSRDHAVLMVSLHHPQHFLSLPYLELIPHPARPQKAHFRGRGLCSPPLQAAGSQLSPAQSLAMALCRDRASFPAIPSAVQQILLQRHHPGACREPRPSLVPLTAAAAACFPLVLCSSPAADPQLPLHVQSHSFM